MARIRTIKPEFWRDEDLSQVTAEAALLAIGLLNHSDDEGYFNANPKLIESDVFPLRELSRSTTELLQELASIGYLTLFSGADGKRYGCVVNFAKHQVINKPTPSKIKDLCALPDDSRSDPVVLHVGKERKGKEQGKEQGKEKAVAADAADDSLFEMFWAVYDYKIDKQKAQKAWQKLKADNELARRICQAAQRYVAATPELKFRRHPTTWLNNRSWENEIVNQQTQPQMTHHQATTLAAARAIFGDERNLIHEQRIIDITPAQTPARLLGAENL